jgi:hypothetical protein
MLHFVSELFELWNEPCTDPSIVPDDVLLMRNFGKSKMSKWVVNPFGLGFRSGRPKKTCQL